MEEEERGEGNKKRKRRRKTKATQRKERVGGERANLTQHPFQAQASSHVTRIYLAPLFKGSASPNTVSGQCLNLQVSAVTLTGSELTLERSICNGGCAELFSPRDSQREGFF